MIDLEKLKARASECQNVTDGLWLSKAADEIEYMRSVFAKTHEVAPAVDAQPVATKEQAHKFAIIRDRNYDGEGLSLWTWDGEYYVGADGDCLSPDPDGTLDGYTAEWLTDYQLEMRLNDASAQSEGLSADLSLRALYEDACIQANKNSQDAARWRYAVRHWLDEHIATKQADEAIAALSQQDPR
jgi:hypothetical protein